MGENIIIAPHPDDEVIGCYSLLADKKIQRVIYGDHDSKVRDVLDAVPIEAHDFFCFQYEVGNVEALAPYMGCGNNFLFPDPYFEVHPDHRYWGAIGEGMLRSGENVIFYSVNMQAPYIRKVGNPSHKVHCLNLLYPSKADLWKYEHKYFLFEGQCRWYVDGVSL